MGTISRLAEYFAKFPGIGPRQSKRFVFFLLRQDERFLNDLSEALKELKKGVALCISCYRFFSKRAEAPSTCSICADGNREAEKLMIVEKDVDLENIERAGTYRGYYFVLGGSLSLMERRSDTIRTKELVRIVGERAQNDLQEVIIATSASPDGEHTADEVKKLLEPLSKEHNFSISTLGRGLSTGLELEYSDTETIKSALKNRA